MRIKINYRKTMIQIQIGHLKVRTLSVPTHTYVYYWKLETEDKYQKISRIAKHKWRLN